MSNDITALAQRMKEHAGYIINLQTHEPENEEALIHAYDQADRIFSSENVLALVEALEATAKTSAARKEAITRTHKMFQRERDRADAAEHRIAELEKAATEPTMYQARMWNPAYDEWDSWEECNVNAFEVFSQEAERGEGMEVRKLYAASPTLESRAVTVKLPDINEYLAEVHDKTLALAFRRLAEGVRDGDIFALRAAGIQVIEGEGQ